MLDGSISGAAKLLPVPLFLLLPSLIAVLAAEKRARAATGRPLAVERPGLWLRRALLAGPQVAVLAVVLARGDLLQEPAAEVLMFGILLAWLVPGSRDAVLGETGVRRGWSARRFEELEEWRLAGDHLSFRLHGEETSVPCPPVQQAWVREALITANAAGESRVAN